MEIICSNDVINIGGPEYLLNWKILSKPLAFYKKHPISPLFSLSLFSKILVQFVDLRIIIVQVTYLIESFYCFEFLFTEKKETKTLLFRIRLSVVGMKGLKNVTQ